jgi:hypothetical protein
MVRVIRRGMGEGEWRGEEGMEGMEGERVHANTLPLPGVNRDAFTYVRHINGGKPIDSWLGTVTHASAWPLRIITALIQYCFT